MFLKDRKYILTTSLFYAALALGVACYILLASKSSYLFLSFAYLAGSLICAGWLLSIISANRFSLLHKLAKSKLLSCAAVFFTILSILISCLELSYFDSNKAGTFFYSGDTKFYHKLNELYSICAIIFFSTTLFLSKSAPELFFDKILKNKKAWSSIIAYVMPFIVFISSMYTWCDYLNIQEPFYG